MAIKPNGEICRIKEQIIEDAVSGITLQFEVMQDGSTKLVLFGDCMPFSNREFFFDAHGIESGAGTLMTGACKPNWLRPIAKPAVATEETQIPLEPEQVVV